MQKLVFQNHKQNIHRYHCRGFSTRILVCQSELGWSFFRILVRLSEAEQASSFRILVCQKRNQDILSQNFLGVLLNMHSWFVKENHLSDLSFVSNIYSLALQHQTFCLNYYGFLMQTLRQVELPSEPVCLSVASGRPSKFHKEGNFNLEHLFLQRLRSYMGSTVNYY